MKQDQVVIGRIRQALRSEPRIQADRYAIGLAFENGDLIIAGQTADIAAKKLALEAAASVPGVGRIIDRLHVAPAEAMADGQARDLTRNALLQEPTLSECAIRVWVKGAAESVRSPTPARGMIDIRVENGVVTLDGEVPSLAAKRLAGVLAWWVPGSRDVVNGLGVEPAETDSDDEITEAIRVALEKDPFVNAGQIRLATKDAVVTLAGLVPTDAEREMAEFDAWYVFGVDRVINRIVVRA